MGSKKLTSILQNVPSATAQGQNSIQQKIVQQPAIIEKTRIVASIPKILKQEIKTYIENNKGETETTLVLKGLQKIGFNVNDSWLIDKRTLR